MAGYREEVRGSGSVPAEAIAQVYRCVAATVPAILSRGGVLLGYLRGLMSPVERKHGWQLAHPAGVATQFGVQRLLSTYRWDADLVREDLSPYVVQHLAEADGVLVVD